MVTQSQIGGEGSKCQFGTWLNNNKQTSITFSFHYLRRHLESDTFVDKKKTLRDRTVCVVSNDDSKQIAALTWDFYIRGWFNNLFSHKFKAKAMYSKQCETFEFARIKFNNIINADDANK